MNDVEKLRAENADPRAHVEVLEQEVRELEQQRDAARTELRDVLVIKQQLTEERDTAVAQLAGYRVLFEEQGRALTATRASVASLRERLDQYMPIDSVLDSWDWHAIAREADRLSPLRFAAEALAKVADATTAKGSTGG